MPLFKSLLMAGKRRNYNPMSEDGCDGKAPLYNDEAFEHGIQFHVKFIGSHEVPKPSSRGEIVAGMRRIRYDFKARAVKKRQVNLRVSTDGIQAILRTKNYPKDLPSDTTKTVLMQYPIYRVFYVSHDSLDLKIFSFIVRDYDNNSFRCYVFKEYKKNEAMRIVRTIGQAFEVCHKISLQNTASSSKAEEPTPSEPLADPKETSDPCLETVEPTSVVVDPSFSSEESLKHQMQFLQEQIDHLQQQTELAVDQMRLVKDQLHVETNARIDAQKKNNELLERNRELLNHIQQLLIYSHQLELSFTQQKETFKSTPARPTDLLLLPSNSRLGLTDLSSDSPDSGKGNEISSESINEQPWTPDPLPTPMHSISSNPNQDCHWYSSAFANQTFSHNPFQTEFDALVQ